MAPRLKKWIVVSVGISVLAICGVMMMIGIIKHNQELRNQEEAANVEQAFDTRFAFLADKYLIDKVVVLDGEYAAVLLSIDSLTYRSVLRKENGNWVVVYFPEVVLTYKDFSEIPRDIIKSINQLKKE